ncbi:hypothetical protein [Streptomyces longwoodensis]|uniref:hypothetical protein n=1 Tax=Streptomyces longwoodensis TaxID=68231 RepID=UPI0036E2F39C
MAVEVGFAEVSGSIEVPLKVSVGDLTDAVVGTMTLRIRDGVLEDWRKPLATALRSMAEDAETLPDHEEVDDATA